jgi:anaerobic dimethyl sulfoxide reductase subunit C (anchor subunit)
MNVREWALPIYTILMQIAIGILLMLWIIRLRASKKLSEEEMNLMMRTPITIILFTTIFAMIGAHFHLSKPYLSLTSILNFRFSWLSREIVFTILFFISVGLLWLLQMRKRKQVKLKSFLGWIAIFLGWATIYCMAQIYLLPTQISWNSPLTITYFIVTTILLGVMATAAILIMDLRFTEVRGSEVPYHRISLIRNSLTWLAILALIMVVIVIAVSVYQVLYLQDADKSAVTSLELLLGLYQPLFSLRLVMILMGVVWLIYSVVQMTENRKTVQESLTPIYGSCLLVMIGEILGRFLFYATHVRLGI